MVFLCGQSIHIPTQKHCGSLAIGKYNCNAVARQLRCGWYMHQDWVNGDRGGGAGFVEGDFWVGMEMLVKSSNVPRSRGWKWIS